MLNIFRNSRVFVAFSHDVFWAFASFWLSICLRYGILWPWNSPISDWLVLTSIFVFCQIICFQIFGLYIGIWRFSSSEDLMRVIKSSTFGVLLSILTFFLWNRMQNVPRSIFIINWLLMIMGLGGGRFLYRFWKDKRTLTKFINESKKTRKNVLIVGAGYSGERIFREIRSNYQLLRVVVGFLDDNPKRHGRSIHDIKVIGGTEKMQSVVSDFEINEVLIAIPSATSEELKRIVDFCKKSKVRYKTLPALSDIFSRKVEFSLFRNVELEDLLGREVVKLDTSSIGSMIEDKIVMVSGAGGSIGSELCKQIARFGPRRLILFEICEFFLYQLEMNLKEQFLELEIIPIIGDIRNRRRVSWAMETFNPQIVLHAAAYKHVPMMELNPMEAINTNIFGTQIIADESGKHGVEKFVLISTDKAINPTNIMGTSKRVAEMVCQKLQEKFKTSYIIVRFGNVLGSNGSVIPLFKKQIERGGPLTITHSEITRYFMSILEASQLVLQAATMGDGGEIFVLEMGKPIKIINLAREMIDLAGLTENEDINIEFTGLRPGEKLFEELFSSKEKLINTSHEKVSVAKSISLLENFDKYLDDLMRLEYGTSAQTVIEKLRNIVPEFVPTSKKVEERVFQ